jgi:serine/threonine protein kinase
VRPATLAGGRYALERPLGRGGMAEVMLARDTALDRDVAVKLLAERVRGDRDLRERFLREGRFAARLSHPNVVGVYDSGEEDGRPYLVMECVDGVSLAEELARRGPLAPAETAALGRQACEGLAHAHARGLVHRDVKPQNLLLRPDGTVKVADFGIARAAGGATLTQAGTLLGTAAYMAPEVVAGKPAGPAADVYSLGAVLYELVTGEPPQRARTLAELAEQEPPRPPSEHAPGIPPGFEETIMRCLARDPAQRPSAEELARELALPAAPSEAPTEITRGRTPARPHRRRFWLVPAGVVAAATAVTLAIAATTDDDPPPPQRVQSVPVGRTPAEDARNLADWLRANAG